MERVQALFNRFRASVAARPDTWIGAAFALAAFFLYARTMPPTVLDGDSGEYQYMAYILGVPHSDPLLAEIHDLKDVPHPFLREVEHFFATYKQLEGVSIEVGGWSDAAAASAEVHACVDRYAAQLARTAKSRLG